MINNRQLIFMVIFTLGLMDTSLVFAQTKWQKINSVVAEGPIKQFVIHPQNPQQIIFSTEKGLYLLDLQTNSQKQIASGLFKGDAINDLYIEKSAPFTLYAAGKDGLFSSSDFGETWQTLFKASKEEEVGLSVLKKNGILYLGTASGLFYKTETAVLWNKKGGLLRDIPIYKLEQDSQNLYLSDLRKVYRLALERDEVEEVYSVGREERAFDVLSGIWGGLDKTETTETTDKINDLFIVGGEHTIIFLASSKGVEYSIDEAATWQKFPSAGLPLASVTSLLIKQAIISHGQEAQSLSETLSSLAGLDFFVGTKEGVFSYQGEHWAQMYEGLETNDVRFLDIDQQTRVVAATDQGLFFMPVEKAVTERDSGVQEANQNSNGDFSIPRELSEEPSIQQVQEWAVRYAEVSPDKIWNWRKQARAKALLPSLEVGLDRQGSDLYQWDTGTNPDALRKGHDFLGWDVGLKWNFSDLIWSTDQTTIDVRSKLMVELREDVLDEVTRLYFERRRIQMGLISGNGLEDAVRLEKQIRVTELTALIDAFTGGQYSRRLEDYQKINRL